MSDRRPPLRERLAGRSAVPPPLVYLGAIGIGWLLQHGWPVPIAPGVAARRLGGAVAAAGGLLCLLSVRECWRASTTIRPDGATRGIVRTGPFRVSRNPMYLGLAVVQAGVGLWLDSAWVVGMLVASLSAMTRVVAAEERYLEARFGAAYRDYRRSVRRWL